MISQPSHKSTTSASLGDRENDFFPQDRNVKREKKDFLSLDASEILRSEIVVLFCTIIQHMWDGIKQAVSQREKNKEHLKGFT